MFARVVTAPIKPGTMQEGIGVYENSIVPAMKEQPGFLGTTFLVNERENKVMSISLWETEAAMQASEASGNLQAQMAKVAPLMTAPPRNEHFETAVQVQELTPRLVQSRRLNQSGKVQGDQVNEQK